MIVVHSTTQARHAPRHFLVRGQPVPSPERPGRADALLAAVNGRGDRLLAAGDRGMAAIAAVHSPDYLQFLRSAWQDWQALPGAADEVIPNVHPGRRPAAYPGGVVGRAGWHQADTACPIGEGTWEAAYGAAQAALQAAVLVHEGAAAAYALVRPPGHHAFADMAGGFCFLNNTAIAADWLTRQGRRVAVLDVDVHHGNGTQAIFYSRSDVLHVSLHADPGAYYPYFWGYADERGEGRGSGYNLNLPLPVGSDDDAYLAALPRALDCIGTFAPDALVVALGLDAFAGDPLAGMTISTAGFGRIAAAIAALRLPTVLVQEGGYPCPELGDNLASFLAGFEAGPG